MRTRVAMVAWAGLAMVAGTGCDLVLGFDNPTPPPGGSGGSGAGTSSGGGTTGGGTGSLCEPGTKKACAYTGDPATENVGECHAATQKCDADGTSYEPCEGEVLPAAEVCHNAKDENCDGVACAAPLWSKLWGDAGDQSVMDIGVDAQGRIIIDGSFIGSMNFEGFTLTSAKETNYAAAIDANGNPDGSSSSLPGILLMSSSGAIVVAKPTSDTSLQLLDAAWGTSWTQTIAASGMTTTFKDTTIASNGDLWLMGDLIGSTTFGGTTLSPNGGRDVFLLEVEPGSGVISSAKKFGASGSQEGRRLERAPGGDLVVAGIYTGPLLFPADPAGDKDTFVVRLTSNADTLWGKGFPGTVHTRELAVDALGASILVGRFTGALMVDGLPLQKGGAADLFAIKLSAAGTTVWPRAFGGPQFEAVEADPSTSGVTVATDSQQNVLIATRGKGTIDFGGGSLGKPGEVNEFLVKLDKEGNHVWSKVFGPVGTTGTCVVTITSKDEPILACGVEAASIDLGNGSLPGKGGLDVVMAKFAP